MTIESSWDDIRRVADEIEVQIHLASMDARDRWRALQPRLLELEQRIVHSGEHTGEFVTREVEEVGAALRDLRDEVYARVRGDFAAGW